MTARVQARVGELPNYLSLPQGENNDVTEHWDSSKFIQVLAMRKQLRKGRKVSVLTFYRNSSLSMSNVM